MNNRHVLALGAQCFEEGIDFYGNDVGSISTSTLSNCQIECQKSKMCKYWTYNAASSGLGTNCWLKSLIRRSVCFPSNCCPTLSNKI